MLTAHDFEVEYDNRRRVSESAGIAARWAAASTAYRHTARAELDIPYGPGTRHRFDLFFGGPVGAPLLVYIHGGYWQWGDRATYSFIAEAFNGHGVNVALPSYSLCPTVSVNDIISELRACLSVIWSRTSSRPLVMGHSAGGHLASALLATDWHPFPGLPADLVTAGVAISGIFDLRPLIGTSMNAALSLDKDSARADSTLFWAVPPGSRTLLAAVGSDESREFRRQSRTIVDTWGKRAVKTDYLEVPGANHFTILDDLCSSQSELMSRALGLLFVRP